MYSTKNIYDNEIFTFWTSALKGRAQYKTRRKDHPPVVRLTGGIKISIDGKAIEA